MTADRRPARATHRGSYRRRLREVAESLNVGSTDLNALLARADSYTGPTPRRTRGAKDTLRLVCERCLEPRPVKEFPPDDLEENADRARVCVPCLREAREVEAVRRLVYGDVGAWATARLASDGLILAPWGEGVLCPHCAQPSPQTSAYTWACRHGWEAGVCQGLFFPHVHSVCRTCGYEAMYDEPEGSGERRIA